MNSYPPELLTQLAPVMFVAGLDAPPPTAATSGVSGKPPDAFQVLAHRLRDALLAQRNVAVWQPEKNKSFQVILVDKEVRFPPRKLVPPEDPLYSSSHSPLSPLTPSSPLHPDGLIAPIWIRKHTTLLPSVFVLFLRIFEQPPHILRSPLDAQDSDHGNREQAERKHDTDLAAEIAQRKKGTNERSIKLTVVLMASRRLLDDSNLDARLTFIRRQSGLDSRAALFVLSPVSSSELHDFVRSLQQALYEPALEYYTAHSKRVRRKRNRHSQGSSSYPNPAVTLVNPNIARPLRPEGWTVRYEYKMACFAEFRGEDEVALKHYQDAYGMLIIMFGSTAILPPRTKRWAEAKVLADCISIKIVKLYLYNNEHALALSHHNIHIRQFGDFSRGWGIGEETFEFWSWIARQHRILAELLDQGTKSGLVIPVHKPTIPPAPTSQSTRGAVNLDLDIARTLGINPSHALQHSGFYYYMAARCTEMRRERFLAAVDAELSHKPIALSPGFTNEKKVEHLSIILELYTKAYELFKKYTAQNQGSGRLTLWIAYRIAETYHEAGKFDMAVRFFERIAKTYRRETWDAMLLPLLSTWYSCAQQLGDVDLSIKLLIEMMGHDIETNDDPSSLEEDLIAVLQSTVPKSVDEPLVIDVAEARPIFDSNVVFWSREVKIGEPASFQLSLTAPSNVVISSIPFSTLKIHLCNTQRPIIIRHQSLGSESLPSVQKVDVGSVTSNSVSHPEAFADLRWQPGGTIIIAGLWTSDEPSILKITELVLLIEANTWKIELPLKPCNSRNGSASKAKWFGAVNPPKFIPIQRPDYSTTIVQHKPHLLQISINHHSPAYLDEIYPIVIEVANIDCRELDVLADILLQPTDIDYAVNSISLDDQTSSSLIKDIHFGFLAPGVSASKTLYLSNTGAAGNRSMDISITSSTRDLYDAENQEQDEEDEVEPSNIDKSEHQQTLVILTVAPFTVENDIVYQRTQEVWPGLADLTTFDEDYWDDRKGGEALINLKFKVASPWNIFIEKITLETEDTTLSKVVNCSLDLEDGNLFPAEYVAGDEFCMLCRTRMTSEHDARSADGTIPSPGQYNITWHRILDDGTTGSPSTSLVPLPALKPHKDDLVALLDVPSTATLHNPFPLTLTIRNYHPIRSANITVQLDPDNCDGFVIDGLRSGRIPLLLPGTEEKLTWSVIAIDCGFVKIPRIKVFDRRRVNLGSSETDAPEGHAEAMGEVVKVVDLHMEMRQSSQETGESTTSELGCDTILVLPDPDK